MTHRNAYMTDELQAIYDQTVDFVTKEVIPHGESWEEAGRVPRDVLLKSHRDAGAASAGAMGRTRSRSAGLGDVQ